MGEKNSVPKRRYHGFTENWDKRKLENLASFSKGKGYSKKDLTDIGHQLILYGRLYTNYETVIKKVDTYTIKQENSMLSKGREVIVPSSGETREDIARASVILEPNIIIGGDLNVIIPSKDLDSVFLALNISNGSCQRELMKRAQGSSVVHLYNEDLISVTLHFPSVKEQQIISEFFKKLDERIANQERKVAKVKALKSAYLTEMFPQEGETVPKRRFKGFEDNWKVEKLGDQLEFLKGKGLPLTSFDIGNDQPAIAYGHLYTVYEETIYKVNLSSSDEDGELSKAGDVLFPGSSTVPNGTAQASAIMIDNVKLGGDIIIGRQINRDIYAPFLSYQINSCKKKLYPITVGTTITHMYGSDLEKIVYSFPSYKEQQKIGAFFKNLDDQIETEEKKLDKLQKMKEAYLEEMFV